MNQSFLCSLCSLPEGYSKLTPTLAKQQKHVCGQVALLAHAGAYRLGGSINITGTTSFNLNGGLQDLHNRLLRRHACLATSSAPDDGIDTCLANMSRPLCPGRFNTSYMYSVHDGGWLVGPDADSGLYGRPMQQPGCQCSCDTFKTC